MADQNQNITVEPIFLKEEDMPEADIAPLTVVRAITLVVSPQGVDGAQKIGKLWKIYMKTLRHRIDLLAMKTVRIQAKRVPMYDQNPYKTNQGSPEDRKDKITIKGLPISVSSQGIQNMLESKGVVLSSWIMYAHMRDENGGLTEFKNGDRFFYCEPLPNSIPRQQKVCGFYCSVYHHGRDNARACKSCARVGHKSGDSECPARVDDGAILAFSGYQHPLSNHFMTPIDAFGAVFKTVEHAFFWKMSSDMGLNHLAEKIKNSEHAGIVKRLSKEINETERIEWEESNLDIMKELLMEKALTCEQFKQCLLMNKDKVLAESTFNKRWGTGLTKWVTEATTPTFWPGNNLLGVLLMELTEELASAGHEGTMDVDYNAPITTRTVVEVESEEDKDEDSDEESDDTIKNKSSQVKGERATRTVHLDHAPNTTPNATQRKKTKNPKKKPEKKDMQSSEIKTVTDTESKTNNNNTNNTKDNYNRDQSKDSTAGNSGIKERNNPSPGRRKLPDIRVYLDPKTGKRKQPDTTPEKNLNEKKASTTS